MSKNLHKYYYKDYFNGINFSYLETPNQDAPDNVVSTTKQRNRELTGNQCSNRVNGSWTLKEECKIPDPGSPNKFSLDVQYPGLVTGIGINHETKIEGEFKLGVHFDWTHGMPVVYGSSVKGVLRSAFKEGYVDADLVRNANTQKNIREEEMVPNWVGDETNKNAIIDNLFNGKENGNPKSIYTRDIFFDAVIVKADPKGRILTSDSITPHGGENHDNPLKNPTPITFMKIASGCRLEFRFKLVDSVINGKPFLAAQKKTLFKEILKTVGIGAKTNVGYGQLVEN